MLHKSYIFYMLAELMVISYHIHVMLQIVGNFKYAPSDCVLLSLVGDAFHVYLMWTIRVYFITCQHVGLQYRCSLFNVLDYLNSSQMIVYLGSSLCYVHSLVGQLIDCISCFH